MQVAANVSGKPVGHPNEMDPRPGLGWPEEPVADWTGPKQLNETA